MTKIDETVQQGQPLSSLKACILRGVNDLLRANDRGDTKTRLHVVFFAMVLSCSYMECIYTVASVE